ncbi:MAG: sugar transferase [Coriobacteriia bacterium]
MSRSRFIALSVVLDTLLVNVGIVAAFWVRFFGRLPSFNFSAYLALWPLLTLVYLASGYVYGLYEPERTEGAWGVAQAAFKAVTLGTVLTVAIAFFAGPRFFSFSRLVILIAWVFHIALLVGWRVALLGVMHVSRPEQRVLVVGTGPLALELASELQRLKGWGYRVVGLLARDEEEARRDTGEFPVLGTAAEATRVVREQSVERVIVASPVALRELVEDLALSDETDVRVDVIPGLYEIFIGTVDHIVSDIPLMELTKPPAPGWYTSAKRAIDVIGALAFMVLASPVLAVADLAIVLTMGRPVLYSQERVGKDLVPFRVYKFRTMVRDAESSTGPVLAVADDARITPVGRFLRRFRIDELPQLANILRGDMSFVGPRPERPFFVERFLTEIPGYRERYKVKPGVTGLAQVSGSYATTPERKLKYDLIYMYHQNLLMDVQILVETLRVVLTGRGAR